MGVEALVQIDRLVQLLETPAFNFLRLQLLHPARYPALLWRAPAPSACFRSGLFGVFLGARHSCMFSDALPRNPFAGAA